jgi:anti-anti-sigma regulatory factor
MDPVRKLAPPGGSTDDPPPGSQVVVLPVDCTVHNISLLRERLCGVAADARDITLDLRQVEQFDTSTLQLLTAFARDRAARGAHLLTCGARPEWDEAVQLLGLTATLAGGSSVP